MLTPRFTLTQTDKFVVADIEAPYVKFSDGEMYMQGNEFSFFCKPYHLKLYFSSEVVEDGSESASYNVQEGKFDIHIPKANKGEVFTDLDMLTKLMTPQNTESKVKASALIEVMDNTEDAEELPDYGEEDIDWSVEQALPADDISIQTTSPRYGFNLQYSNVFTTRSEDQSELLDTPDPDTSTASQRAELEQLQEERDFCSEHYLGDLVEDDTIQEFIIYKSQINKLHHKASKGSVSCDDLVEYTKDEMEAILRLPKKQYLMDQSEKRCALVGLVDILYACLYDIRTTMEEPSVESAWTIRKLSSSLSWLQPQHDVKSTLLTNARRVMCYPLYRHWVLAMKIIEDVRHTLTLGRKQILKCLLYVHKQFNNTESYYIHNSLYITDYCVWIQTVSDSTLRSLANKIKHCHLEKDDVLLNISTLELKFLQDLADSESSNSTSDSSSDTDSDDSSDNEIRPDAEQGNILDSAKPEIDTLQQQLSSLTMQGKQEKKTPSKPLIEIIDEKVVEPLTADYD